MARTGDVRDGRLAGLLREAVVDTAEVSGLAVTAKASPPPGTVTGKNRAAVTFLAADRSTGHASAADIAILDEAGLLEERDRPLWDAVYSSVSGRNGRLLCVSIRGAGPMFAELRDRRDDPAIVWHEYAADPADDPMDPATWHKANPGLRSGVKSLAYMERTARRALASPENMPGFRGHDLNLPTDPARQLVVDVHEWLPVYEAPVPERDEEAVLGLDLGGSVSMTCAAVWFRAPAAWRSIPPFRRPRVWRSEAGPMAWAACIARCPRHKSYGSCPVG